MNRRVLKNQRKKSGCQQPGSKPPEDKTDKDHKNNKYLVEMLALLAKIQPNKVLKMINNIKTYNYGFQAYINENRLLTIKYEDIVKFEREYNSSTLSYKQKKILEAAKIGFLDLKKKMEEFETTDFLTQINYTSLVLQRQLRNLEKTGQEYIGKQNVIQPFFFTDQIFAIEKQNGKFQSINPRLIQKSKTVEKISYDFYMKMQRE